MTDEQTEVAHIRHTHASRLGTSWCGAKGGLFFQSIDHAAYTVMQDMMTLPCTACVNAVINALVGHRAAEMARP